MINVVVPNNFEVVQQSQSSSSMEQSITIENKSPLENKRKAIKASQRFPQIPYKSIEPQRKLRIGPAAVAMDKECENEKYAERI